MDALLQAFGLALGGLFYVLAALALARWARGTARGAVALYWRVRSEAEAQAQIARVVELQARRPQPQRQRRAA